MSDSCSTRIDYRHGMNYHVCPHCKSKSSVCTIEYRIDSHMPFLGVDLASHEFNKYFVLCEQCHTVYTFTWLRGCEHINPNITIIKRGTLK